LFKRPPPLGDEERRQFLPHFCHDIEQLEPMIGRDLSAWLR